MRENKREVGGYSAKKEAAFYFCLRGGVGQPEVSLGGFELVEEILRICLVVDEVEVPEKSRFRVKKGRSTLEVPAAPLDRSTDYRT